MSEADDQPHIHICRGTNPRYRARVRRLGCRKYELVGKWTKSNTRALSDMVKAFATGRYKRADVIYVTDYYDPVVLCELVKL
jgi:hypothetical protein